MVLLPDIQGLSYLVRRYDKVQEYFQMACFSEEKLRKFSVCQLGYYVFFAEEINYFPALINFSGRFMDKE